VDQLDLKEFEWSQLSQNLEDQSLLPPSGFMDFHDIFDNTKSNIEFSQTVSKFLMDRNRAGSLWVNLQMYVNLGTQLLKILRASDK
jgi:hypothetical protein